MLAASAVFRAAPTPSVAADVVGALLARWHYIALAAPSILFTLETARARRTVIIVIFAGLLLAAAQTVVDLRIRQIRFNSVVPVSSLDPDDPVRRRFGALHGLSMMLLLAEAIAAAIVVAAKEKTMSDEQQDTTIYKVVETDYDQYSIWPADRENALGWKDAGFQGTREECLAHIEEVWGDLHRRVDADTSGGGP